MYGDGFGTRTTIKHDDVQSGTLYIKHENTDPPCSVTFLPQELEELAALIASVVEYNREHGLHPYKGRTAIIEGMEVRIVEPTP
jgi:hypothetical protein